MKITNLKTWDSESQSILAGRLNGHFLDDLLVDRGVHWDFLNDGVGDGNLRGSEVRGRGSIGVTSIVVGGSQGGSGQGDGGSRGLISRPLLSGLSGEEAWNGVSEAVDFNFDLIGYILVLNWGREGNFGGCYLH